MLAAAVLVSVLSLVPSAGAATRGAAKGSASQSTGGYVGAVVRLVNAQRAAAGLAPVSADRRLARAARRFSRDMVRQRFFDHVSPHGSTVGQRVRKAGFTGRGVAETIAWGAGPNGTPETIVAMWMASAGHRAILMSGGYRRIGVGVASGSPAGLAAAKTVTADFGT
ncbi:MAG: hypothetical protein QOH46_2521 [Solirubrobacteraceae bacterium]|jgi:uncharacterized protein YkwD|nr:hypothetical protein [Solirubrobacteraceae bacterium]